MKSPSINVGRLFREHKGLRRIAVLLLLASIATWRILQAQPHPVIYLSLAWLALVALLVWLGNRALTRLFDRTLPWNRYGTLRFFIHLAAGLLYLLLLVNTTYYGLKISLTNTPPIPEQMIVMNVYGIVLFIPGYSIYFSLHFLRHWRTSELEVERYQKETAKAQLTSLKNHLDPHFLFNNLNILSALVEKSPEQSKLFIDKFADVYRGLLRTSSDDLIPLREELAFIEAYMYLLNIRFDQNILFLINVSTAGKEKMIPPATLQLLIENAVKHNLISAQRPLSIQLLEQMDGSLLISNTVYENAMANGMGTGLENISNRYQHFTANPVIIEKTGTHFNVTIPLLTIEVL